MAYISCTGKIAPEKCCDVKWVGMEGAENATMLPCNKKKRKKVLSFLVYIIPVWLRKVMVTQIIIRIKIFGLIGLLKCGLWLFCDSKFKKMKN